MSAGELHGWLERNQHELVAEVARVRSLLERHLERGRGGEPPEPPAAPGPRDPSSALESLCHAFGLSPFERDLLLLCAGVELDARLPALCTAAHGDAHRVQPTFGLALAALPEPHWSALTPGAPLRRWLLIEVGAGEGLTTAPLRVDERVLHFLAGINHLEERLHPLLFAVPVPELLPPSQEAVARRIAAHWARAQEQARWPAFQLCGDEVAAKPGIAAAAAAALGLQLCALRAADLPAGAEEREVLLRLWEREAVLGRSALLVECEEEAGAEAVRALVSFVERVEGVLILTGREPLEVARRPVVRLDVRRPDAVEQHRLWEAALGPAAGRVNGQLERVVAQFDLGSHAIRLAGARVVEDEAGAEISERLWEACRLQARGPLEGLAQRIEPAARWDDLVLPAPQRQTLREIAVHVRHRYQVYEGWGFARKSSRGLGISALFSGSSGTGKTMAAEVLAGELALDLFRIDLSAVVSKYIGETEKNLKRVFDAAEEGGAILLFDEADALFGKRSEVKDSHDRYANLEISYLLQRMEAYRGLAILTTNLQDALDTAFLRRIRFVVHFPFPDVAQRTEIWRRVFPAELPTAALDVESLARLNVAGGNIRNIALHAAFLAAEEGEPVGMPHLLRAARNEYQKLDRPVAELEARGWG